MMKVWMLSQLFSFIKHIVDRRSCMVLIHKIKLNTKQTDRLTTFETSIVKIILKSAPFHHSDLLLDALKLKTTSEKLDSIK
jgi:hypothetical protein